MIQFLADTIDQLDLALDQLAVRDRNFDRFAIMLVDNAVELSLHHHAQDRSYENDIWGQVDKPKHDTKLISRALGQNFDVKVKLGRETGLISDELADSLLYLHAFRNTSYHRGLRHEGILHSLAIFYIENACSLLQKYKPFFWASSSRDIISHRATKYIGSVNILYEKDSFSKAWGRLAEVANAIPANLVQDLAMDMLSTIESYDSAIQFLADDSPEPQTRKEAVINSQAWKFAFSEEGKAFARDNGCPEISVKGHVDWLIEHYRWPITEDPIPSWRRRLESLKKETNKHKALKKYSDFMRQTEMIRDQIDESATQLDGHIQHLVDVARGK